MCVCVLVLYNICSVCGQIASLLCIALIGKLERSCGLAELENRFKAGTNRLLRIVEDNILFET